MIGEIEYMLSNRYQRIPYIRIVRHNFACSRLGGDDRQVTGKMV